MAYIGAELLHIVCFGMMFTAVYCNGSPYKRNGPVRLDKMVNLAASGDNSERQDDWRRSNTREVWLQTALKTGGNLNDMPGTGQCGAMRVVGGHVADEDCWPWQAELVEGKDHHLCGGTIVSNEHILTAAHCFDRYDKNDIVVRVGSRNRNRHESNEQVYPISCLHIHSKYNISKEPGSASIDYDIALLKLKTPVSKTTGSHGVLFNEHVAPALLPRRREFKTEDALCVVTGWGYTDFMSLLTRRMPSRLIEARVPLISAKTCREVYPSLTNRMVCAGYMEGQSRTDTCKGDSGGPLVCQSKDGKWKLWGVTSWGKNYFCNHSPTDPAPGVYTRVDKFVNWIEKNMSKRRCS